MNPIQIKDYIANMGPATRIKREEKAAWFLAHTDSLPELIKLCFDTIFLSITKLFGNWKLYWKIT